MMSTTLQCPQVPGDSGGDADDSRQELPVVRGEMNLRAGSINCQTTNAFHTDNEPNNDRIMIGSSPTEDVVQVTVVNDPAPTEVVTRARKKWTLDMNIFILRTYFILTSLESETNNYLSDLHTKFTEQFPNMEVSKQRVGDQRRSIIRNKLLTTQQINKTRMEAEIIINSHLTQNITITSNATPLSQTTNPPQRMRWSNVVNETITRAYYRITELETNKSGYRSSLYRAVVAKHPELSHVSEQRIADQRRAIINNKLINTNRIQQIRDEISLELALAHSTPKDTTTDDPGNQVMDTNLITDTHNDTVITTTLSQPTHLEVHRNDNESTNDESNLFLHVSQISNDKQQDIDKTFAKATQMYKNTHPTARPTIPKQRSSHKLDKISQYINSEILPKHISGESDFLTIQTALYCAAYTAATENGCKIRDITIPIEKSFNKKPKWQVRLETRIEKLRVSIGRLTEYIKGNQSPRLRKHIELIKNNHKIHSQHEVENTELTHFLDTLKQKVNALASRLRRYLKTTKRKTQNTLFTNNEKIFYRQLNNEQSDNSTPREVPNSDSLHKCWSDIWATPKEHNKNSDWIKQDANTLADLEPMTFENISLDLLQHIIKKTHNWKATGSDKIHNYWYKKFTYLHPYLQIHINSFIKEPETMPSYITLGVTYMLPKDKTETSNPSKYRPITCLQNIYKIITSCISELIYRHANTNQLLAEEQKGCRRYSQGCKEQLTIDTIASKQAITKKRNMYTMYIDYKKAFDSVPHSWLIYILEHYKIHSTIVSFLRVSMLNWKTILKLNIGGNSIETESIPIRRGIFQGDSLSPLWFCLALNPMSNLLNNCKKGFKIKYDNNYHTLSHLMYMDDIKLFGSSLQEIHTLADITQTYSTDIQMEFGIDKCKLLSVNKGKIEQNTYELTDGQHIDPVDQKSGYKYLGYFQTRQIHYKQTKLTIEQKFKSRLHKILNTQLNAKNTIKAINTFAIPVLTYSFGIIHWSQTNLIKLQRTINTLMTKYRKHHPRSCVERLTLPHREGGRGLIDLKNLHNTQVTILRNFFHKQATRSSLHNAITQADNNYTPLNLKDCTQQNSEIITTENQKLQNWLQKSLHGRHRRDLLNPNIDKVSSNMWLKRGELFPETEGFMLGIQDQVIDTRNYRKFIIKDNTSDLCRHCHSASETIQHITGACRSITQTDYKHRHDQVAAIIHQYLAFKYSLITEKTAYYKYTPAIILESVHHKLYWDRTIITDKTIHHNRPDITLYDKSTKTVFLIDIAIPNTHNLEKTYTDKLSKYTDLAIELKTQWRAQTVKTVPIVLSSTGVIPYTLHNSLQTLGIHKLTFNLLQKAVILNTCRIVRKFLFIDD